MKIALLGHKRVPSRVGGVEIVVNELAVRLSRMGHEVYVYNRNCGEERPEDFENVHFVEIPTFKSSTLNAVVYALFATIHIIFHKYDVVHYHAEGPCSMLPLAKLFGKKTVATIHGLDWQRAKWGGFATRYLRFGEKMAAKHAHALISLSPSMRKYFLEEYSRESIVIPNGINPVSPVEPDIIKELGLEKRNFLLFLARITPEKGLDYLLEAYQNLHTDMPLVVAGGLTPSTPYIEEVKAKASQIPGVKLIGFVDGQKLEELFSNCYVYILPSDLEGMPISLLEAISYRTRVLVSSIPENVDMLQGYGNVFEKSNPASLEDKLREMLDHKELYDCDFKSDKSPEDVTRQIDELIRLYDWDEITEKTLKIYESV